MLICLKVEVNFLHHLIVKELCKPLSFLEVHYRCRDEESMATCGHTDASDIKVWSSGVCLLNSLVCIACTGLLDCQAWTIIWAYTTYLGDFLSRVEMSFIWVWIGHECHSWGERHLCFPSPASHMLCWKVTIHYEGSNKLIPLKRLRKTKYNIWMMTYEVYRSLQSAGRLNPGCGHAGQNIAIDPYFGGSFSYWCPSPLNIRFLKSLHWREARRSCL